MQAKQAGKSLNPKRKTTLQYLILLIGIPAVILLGTLIFRGRQYAFIALAVAVLACLPFFLSFEKGGGDGKKLVILAVLTALASVGRFAFLALPHFKPVTALVIITALCLGPQSGFIVGAMTALISNFYFGQGPWTPFQMFSWGMVGFLAGLLAPRMRGGDPRSKILLCLYGVAAGILYSLLMDGWITLWADNSFQPLRCLANITAALPITLTYAASNVVFLLLFAAPIGAVLERIRDKYGLGQ